MGGTLCVSVIEYINDWLIKRSKLSRNFAPCLRVAHTKMHHTGRAQSAFLLMFPRRIYIHFVLARQWIPEWNLKMIFFFRLYSWILHLVIRHCNIATAAPLNRTTHSIVTWLVDQIIWFDASKKLLYVKIIKSFFFCLII